MSGDIADITPLIPEREKGMTASELRGSGDVQLIRALDLLTQSARREQNN